MNNEIEVSVILPARNEGRFLESSLSAVLRSIEHSGFNCEIIVVDNYSNDDTIDIAQEFQCTIVRNEKENAASSRNKGASIARGKYFAFIDADCIINEYWILFMLETLINKGNSVVAVGTKPVPDFAHATWIERAFYAMWDWKINVSNEFNIEVKYLSTSNLMVKKESFDSVRGFNESLVTGEDYDLGIRLSKLGKIIIDTRINTTHLREAKTTIDLFKKEFFRGSFNLRGLLVHGIKIKEIPSIIVPVLHLFFLILSVVLMIFDFNIATLVGIFSFIVPFALAFRSRKSIDNPKCFIQIFWVSIVYLLARGLSTIKEFPIIIFQNIFHFKKI